MSVSELLYVNPVVCVCVTVQVYGHVFYCASVVVCKYACVLLCRCTCVCASVRGCVCACVRVFVPVCVRVLD